MKILLLQLLQVLNLTLHYDIPLNKSRNLNDIYIYDLAKEMALNEISADNVNKIIVF